MQRITVTRSLTFLDFPMSQKKCLQIPCILLSFQRNIIWTCGVGPVIYLSVVLISFAKKVAIDFCEFLSQLLRLLSSLKLWNKQWGSPCSFKSKGAFISLPSLIWGNSLTFCTCTRSCARANDSKIVRSRDAQCSWLWRASELTNDMDLGDSLARTRY